MGKIINFESAKTKVEARSKVTSTKVELDRIKDAELQMQSIKGSLSRINNLLREYNRPKPNLKQVK